MPCAKTRNFFGISLFYMINFTKSIKSQKNVPFSPMDLKFRRFYIMNNTFFQSTLKISILFAAYFSIFSTANAAGVLDKIFGTNGTVTTVIENDAQAKATKIQTDGKILLLGTRGNGDVQDTVLVRYNQNGSLDAGFGNNGIVVSAFSPFFETANELSLQADGKIVIAGSFYSSVTQSIDFLVARFNQNGTLDTSFGTNGIATVNQGSNDFFNSVTVQTDGKIVAAGRTSDDDRTAVLRFNANGTLDSTFADSGALYFGSSTWHNEVFYAVALYPNGRILLGGTGYNTINSAGIDIIALLETNGTFAQDFGNSGTVLASPSSSSPGIAYDLAILPDGKFLAVSHLAIRRYQSNGTLDMTFRHSYSSLSFDVGGSDIAVRSDGRFFVLQRSGSHFVVAYNNNGRDINRFGNSIGNSSGTDIAVQSDNKFIIIGASGNNFVVTRHISINSPATRIADFDYDEKTDLAVSRFGETVYLLRSSQNVMSYRLNQNSGEGVRFIPEDFYSDSPSLFPLFYWRFPTQNAPAYFDSVTENGDYTSFQWGVSSDIPVGGDYDGETFRFSFPGYRKSTELAIFRPSTGTWWVYNRLTNTASATQWGANGDKPVPADYDYDGITDYAIYRPSTGTWWIRRSSDGGSSAIRFGIASDIPLTGDFDGDGKADLTVYRASEGNWYQLLTTEGFRVVRFGIATDSPVPGDYDGDGRHDIAVFREGVWYISQSTDGLKIVQWGNSGDSPIAVRYDQ